MEDEEEEEEEEEQGEEQGEQEEEEGEEEQQQGEGLSWLVQPRRELCFEDLCAASAVSMELDAPRGAEPEAPVQRGGARSPRPGGRSPRPPSRGAEPEAPVQGGGARGPRPGGRSPRPPSRGPAAGLREDLTNKTPGRRASCLKEDQKVWRCVSVSEDPPPPGDTL
ncbi:unnamed protein product [Gadus morhua 'NCC']